MRSTLSLCVVVATLLVLAALVTGASTGSYQSRNKPRTIRGFKNVALSTARGFGKRDGGNSGVLLDLMSGVDQMQDRFMDGFPVDWFVDELQSNPELARIIVHKFIDTNQDGFVTADELLRPTF